MIELKPLQIKYAWYEKFARWLESRGRRRMIYRDGLELLERFYVFSIPLVGIYLHRLWGDDDDGLHDHPWWSISILLHGSYNEEMPERSSVPCGPTVIKRRRPMRPLFHIRSKYAAHRLTIPEDEEQHVWSLFIRFGLKRRKWGFYRNGGWEAAEVQSRREEHGN